MVGSGEAVLKLRTAWRWRWVWQAGGSYTKTFTRRSTMGLEAVGTIAHLGHSWLGSWPSVNA
jgi:hypothetical protein